MWVRNGAGCTDSTAVGDGPGYEPIAVKVLANLPPVALAAAICTGDTLWVGGQPFTQSTQQTITLPAANGCDSLIQLSLSVDNLIQAPPLLATICADDTYPFNGQPLNQSGIYFDTLPGPGCDTLVTLDLNVLPSPIAAPLPPQQLCSGGSVLIADSLIVQAGFYQIKKEDPAGCDTLFLVNVSLDPLALSLGTDTLLCDPDASVTLSASTSACSACSFAWSTGQTITTVSVKPDNSAPYACTVTNPGSGCTVTDVVWVRSEAAQTVTLPDTTICFGESVWFGGAYRSATGEYTVLLRTAGGCDSLVTLPLTVLDEQSQTARPDTVYLPPGVREQRFAVLENDVLADPTQVKLQRLTPPQYGAAEVTPDNRIHYTLIDADYIGFDSLQYSVCDLICPDVCDSATLYIVVQDPLEELENAIPTAFSPNNDGHNDHFDPLNTYRKQGYLVPEDQSTLTIVNSWGERLFHADPYRPWDGRVNGRTVPAATYYFVLQMEVGKKVVIKKPVTVVR